MQYWEDNDRFIVPDGKESFDLEPIELVPADSISGKLVDLENSPLAALNGMSMGRRRFRARNFTTSRTVLATPSPTRTVVFRAIIRARRHPPMHWTVSHRRWPTPYQFEDDNWDAKVVSRKPFVLQVPVHERDIAKQSTAKGATSLAESPARPPIARRWFCRQGSRRYRNKRMQSPQRMQLNPRKPCLLRTRWNGSNGTFLGLAREWCKRSCISLTSRKSN